MLELALTGAGVAVAFLCAARWRTPTTFAAGLACLAVGALEGRGTVLFTGVALLTVALSDAFD